MSFGRFNGLLIHTAVVYRRQEVGGQQEKDRFGQPARTERESHRFACRVTAAKGGERYGDRMTDVVETTHRLFADVGEDLREDDLVTVLDAALEDAEGQDVRDFHQIVTRAEVLLARRAVDGVGEHHREFKLSIQRQSGDPR